MVPFQTHTAFFAILPIILREPIRFDIVCLWMGFYTITNVSKWIDGFFVEQMR